MAEDGTAKYDRLLDAETWAFIRATGAHYPPGAADLPVAAQRAVYDRMCRAFHAGRPAGVDVEDGAIPGPGGRAVPVRRYRPAGGAGAPAEVLYFHGGGFVVGGLDSHDDICAEIAARTGLPVASVDYRLAPEHVFPADFEDAMAAFRHAASGGRRVVLAGDSAGGCLAAAVCGAVRGEAGACAPAGQVLVYPGLGGEPPPESLALHANAPMLGAADIAFYRRLRAGGNAAAPRDPRFAPLAADGFAGIAPTVVFSAECDPLSGDGRAYRDRLRAAGGRAALFEEEGLVHGYLRARHTVRRARESFARVVAAIAALGRGEWPYPPEAAG